MSSLKNLLLLLCITNQCIAMDFLKLGKKKNKSRSNSLSNPQQNSATRSSKSSSPIEISSPITTSHSAPNSPIAKHVSSTAMVITETPTEPATPSVTPIQPVAPYIPPLPKKKYTIKYPECAWQAYRYNDLAKCKERLKEIPEDYYDSLPSEEQAEAHYVTGITANKIKEIQIAESHLLIAAEKAHTQAPYLCGKLLYQKQTNDKKIQKQNQQLALTYLLNYIQLHEKDENIDQTTKRRLSNAEFLLAMTYFMKLVMPGLENAITHGSSKAAFQVAQYYEGIQEYPNAIAYYKEAQKIGAKAKEHSSNHSAGQKAALREDQLKRRLKKNTTSET